MGSPTWTGWLSEVITSLVEQDARGVFHATSRGNISWFEFAKGIVAELGLPTNVLPQSTEGLGRVAPRPAYSTLDVSKLESFLGEPCISWIDGLRGHLKSSR